MDSFGESRNRQKETYTLEFKFFDKIYRSPPRLGGSGRISTWLYHTVNSEADVCVPTHVTCDGRPRALFWAQGDLERQAAKQPYWHPNGRIIISYSFMIRILAQLQKLAIRGLVRVEPLPAHFLSHEHIPNLRGAHLRSLLLFVYGDLRTVSLCGIAMLVAVVWVAVAWVPCSDSS